MLGAGQDLGRGTGELVEARVAVVEVEQRLGSVRVSVSGEIDCASRELLDGVVSTVTGAAGPLRVDLDLGEVTFLDSTGLAFLHRLHVTTTDRGDALVLAPRVQPPVLKLLVLAGVARLLGLPPTPGRATAAPTLPSARSPRRTPPVED